MCERSFIILTVSELRDILKVATSSEKTPLEKTEEIFSIYKNRLAKR